MKYREFVFEQTLKDIVYRGLVCLGANMGAAVAKGRRNSDIVAARRYSRGTQSNKARLSYLPWQIFTISRFWDEFVGDDIVENPHTFKAIPRRYTGKIKCLVRRVVEFG